MSKEENKIEHFYRKQDGSIDQGIKLEETTLTIVYNGKTKSMSLKEWFEGSLTSLQQDHLKIAQLHLAAI